MSPEKDAPVRGVAKHVVSSRQAGRDRLSLASLVDSDEEEGESSPVSEAALPINNMPPLLAEYAPADDGGDSIMEDVMEEDWVDTMRPSSVRAASRPKVRSRKRQRRIEESWSIAPVSGKPVKPPRNAQTLGKVPKPGRKRLRREGRANTKAQQVTVLDAPGFQVGNGDTIPRFLKVVARTSRASVPQDLKGKFLQLNTRGEKLNLNRNPNFGSGRTSGLRVRQNARLKQPPEAAERDGEGQGRVHAPQLDSDALLQRLKSSTDKTLSRLQANIPTTNAAESHQEHPSRLGLGHFFSRVNRSGQGHLLRFATVRPATLEGLPVDVQPQRRALKLPHTSQRTETVKLPVFTSKLPSRYVHFPPPFAKQPSTNVVCQDLGSLSPS
jgi:hypothetical protein